MLSWKGGKLAVSTDQAGFASGLQQAQLKLVTGFASRIALMNIALAIVLAAMAAKRLSSSYLVLWLAGIVVFSIILPVVVSDRGSRMLGVRTAGARLHAAMVDGWVIGSLWALSALELLQTGVLTENAFVPFLIGGYASGLISFFPGYSPLTLGIVRPVLLSFAIGYLMEGQVQSLSLAGILTFVLSYLIRQARSAHNDFTAKYRLSFENEHLSSMLINVRESHAHDTYHDPLTGLPNRAAFSEALEAAMDYVAETQYPVSLLLLDLDHFKSLNDSLGHGKGDGVLAELAGRLNDFSGDQNFVARLGGDEFAVIMRHDERTSEDIHDLVGEITARLSASVELDGRPYSVGLSGGLATAPHDAHTTEEILSCADMALYRAKDLGRRQIARYTADMRKRAEVQQEIAFDLARAIAKRDIKLHFQPQVEVNSERVVGFEGLLRWNHPRFGWVSPPKVITVARDQNLSHDLMEMLLQQAADFLDDLSRSSLDDITVSVNVSPSDLTTLPVPQMVEHLVHNRALDPSRLCLEITEEMVLDGDTAGPQLRALERIGTPLSIDDFGSGHSSFSHLCAFKVSSLKIDQQFVRNCTTSSTDRKILTTIMSLGRSMGVKMVAEGVETAEQLLVIKSIGYPVVQGNFYARALSTPEALAFALKHNIIAEIEREAAETERAEDFEAHLGDGVRRLASIIRK